MGKVKTTLILVTLFLAISFSGCSNREINIGEFFPTFKPEEVKIFYIKEKFRLFKDVFNIYNRQKEPVFKVKGKFISFGDSLRIFDMEGKELFHIREKVISFNSRYRMYKGKNRYAEMSKRLKFFTDKYYLRVKGKKKYEIKGKFADHKYSIYKDGVRVAHISRKWFKWTEHYTVAIAPTEDEQLILSAVIVIDMVNKQKARSHHHVD